MSVKRKLFAVWSAMILCMALAVPSFAATQSPLSKVLTRQKTVLSTLSARVNDALYHVNNLDRIPQKLQEQGSQVKSAADKVSQFNKNLTGKLQNRSYSGAQSTPSTTREYFTNRVQSLKSAVQGNHSSKPVNTYTKRAHGYGKATLEKKYPSSQKKDNSSFQTAQTTTREFYTF